MADHKRRGGLDGKENSAEEERGLHALFGDPEEAAFANPKEGALALADWSRGWGPNLLHHTRRVLGAGPITDFPLTDTGARTAVLLPGVWERWESLATWGRALHALGWNIEVIPELDLLLGSLQELADKLQKALQSANLEQVLIVAHSKGGLVAKQAMLGEEGWRIARLISCGTPYNGAPIASLSVPALQMRSLVPWNEEITSLASRDEPNEKIVAIQAEWDQNVPSDPKLPGAQIITVPVTGHNALLTAPEVIAVISHFAGAQWPEETSDRPAPEN